MISAVKSAMNNKLTPLMPGGPSIPVDQSVAAARTIDQVRTAEQDLSDTSCGDQLNSNQNHPGLLWLRRLEGSHSTSFNVNLEPNLNYEFFLVEYWKGKPTNGSMQTTCGETDILTLSVGPMITTLPYRTYDHQKAPVPPGSSTSEDVLTVGGNSDVSVLGAALLNVRLPIGGLPQWTGVTLSAGPVYKLGTSPGVSSLGVFVGASVHLYRSAFLTPGIHIGQFADFPAGFYPGAVIPNQFGNLTPITRTTAHFAVGITFKTSSFKKTSQDNGTAKNTTNANTPNTQANPNQNVSGNKGK
jgi:hypothetical protein